MRKTLIAIGLALAGVSGIADAAAPALSKLRVGHRVLIVSAPAGNVALAAERRILSEWQRPAQERDIVVVYLDGSKVEGVSDTAAAVRARYAIPAAGFNVALVGKDGHVAYRSSKVVSGAEFENTVDAMPMRRAGQR